MIDFSCADFTFPILSHEKALALIALMGFKWVDVGLFEDRSHLKPSNQLDKPELRGTVYHDAAGQAELAMEYAIALAEGNDVVSEPVPFMRVDQENVDYYIGLEENR